MYNLISYLPFLSTTGRFEYLLSDYYPLYLPFNTLCVKCAYLRRYTSSIIPCESQVVICNLYTELILRNHN